MMFRYRLRSFLWLFGLLAALSAGAASIGHAADGNLPAPAAGFDQPREGIAHGALELVEYESTTVGITRRAHVYLPPGYSTEQKYPVLYLLHGIGGDEHEWVRGGVPQVILDNLYADGKVVPMIVVMPNGRASKDLTARDPIPRQSPAFAAFEQDLLQDLIPCVEARYPAISDRESRAIAGLSMGGGQALNFGLAHLDAFGWVGGFSSAPNTRPAAELATLLQESPNQPALLYIACGDRDFLFRTSEGLHKELSNRQLPHLYNVIPGGQHDFQVWRSELYQFAQRIFQEQTPATDAPVP